MKRNINEVRKHGIRLAAILGILLSVVRPQMIQAYDLGLSTRFSDVILENINIGQTYNISQLKSLPMTVINTSNIQTDVQIDVDVPKKEELKPGYEPIPDPNWVKVLPDRFLLEPGARNLSDIIITVPNDPSLLGRSFQVMFWAHTMDTGFLGVGVRVRVRFTVGAKSPETLSGEAAKKRMLDLNFRLDPVNITAGEIPMGKVFDLKKDKNLTIKLVNTGTTRVKVSVVPIPYRDPQNPPNGYEQVPDVKWVEIEPKVIDAKPDTISPITVKIKVPDLPEYKGKKYAVLLIANLVRDDVPVNVFSQVLFTTGN